MSPTSPQPPWGPKPPTPPGAQVSNASRAPTVPHQMNGWTMKLKATSSIQIAAEPSEPGVSHESHEAHEAVAFVESKENPNPVEAKYDQFDENEDEKNFEKLQLRIKKLHEDLIKQSKKAKSFNQSIQKELEAMNMLKGERYGPANLSYATCPQSGQASQASDGLQAATTSARQACASAKHR